MHAIYTEENDPFPSAASEKPLRFPFLCFNFFFRGFRKLKLEVPYLLPRPPAENIFLQEQIWRELSYNFFFGVSES